MLHYWRHIPGLHGDVVNGTELEKWVREARRLAHAKDRSIIVDQLIGGVLVHAPSDGDGTWPCRPVRELIEITRSSELETGMMTGVWNKLGVTVRNPTDGGAQERELAIQYREWCARVRLDRTSAMLAKIAESYERDAKSHDDDADRGQW